MLLNLIVLKVLSKMARRNNNTFLITAALETFEFAFLLLLLIDVFRIRQGMRRGTCSKPGGA